MTRQTFTRISPSKKKRRYLTEKPKKSVASAETSTDELEEGQDIEQEVIHVAMKQVLINLFKKGSHKIVQNETESSPKKDQV